MKDVAQVQTSALVKADYLKAALLGAAKLTTGRVVVAGDKPVAVNGVTVVQVLLEKAVAMLEAQEALATSA